MAEKTKIG